MDTEKPAATSEQVAAHHASNREAWNEAAVKYTQDIEEDSAFIID